MWVGYQHFQFRKRQESLDTVIVYPQNGEVICTGLQCRRFWSSSMLRLDPLALPHTCQIKTVVFPPKESFLTFWGGTVNMHLHCLKQTSHQKMNQGKQNMHFCCLNLNKSPEQKNTPTTKSIKHLSMLSQMWIILTSHRETNSCWHCFV